MTNGEVSTLAGQAAFPRNAVTKAEHAYQWIRNEILRGAFEPGQSLDQEALAATLGVSTTPLREALRRLESEQLVLNRAHRDTIVAPLKFETLEEAYVVRLELEPLGTSIATKAASDAELEALRTLVNSSPATDDPLTHMQHNGNLHRSIYRASHNATLIRVLDSLSDLVDRYRVLTIKAHPEPDVAQRVHSDVIDAMVGRKARIASRLMRDHIAVGFEQMKDAHKEATS